MSSTDSPPPLPAKDTAPEPTPAPLFPPAWLLVVWGLVLAMFVVWREPGWNETPLGWLRPNDNALNHLLILVSLISATLASCIWLWAVSGHCIWTKLAPLGVLALAIALFRFDGFSGEMWPSFAWRWTPIRHRLLETPAAADPTAPQAPRAVLTPIGAGDFPQFLGPARDGRVPGALLARDWEATPPKEVARWEVGAGWSGFAVVNGFGVTLEQRGDNELVTCYDIRIGKLIWSHAIEARHYNPLGGLGPRSTPTIADGRVYALGATGRLHCLDGATGAVLWGKDLLREFGLTQSQAEGMVQWGRAGSPLIVGQLCIVPAGGPHDAPVSLIAYDRETGAEVWRGGTTQIAYTTPTLATLCGVEQIVSVNESTVTGHNLATGEVLWSYPFPGSSSADANNSQPVAVGDDRLFLSKGYGIGAQLVQVTLDGGAWNVEPIWQQANLLKTKFTNVVIHDGYIYGLDDGILMCAELETGRRMWKKGRYEQGQILLVGDTIVVQAEKGEVVLVDTNPERLVELGRLEALHSQTWNNLAFTSPYLIVRNAEEAATYELPLRE